MLTNILRYSIWPAYLKEGKYYPEFDYKDIFETVKKHSYLSLEKQLLIYIPKILTTNFNAASKENKLGMHIIYLMDLVIEFFKHFKKKPNAFDFIILESGFMDKSINYFFKYQLNNIYQAKFVKLFTLYLEDAENHPLLTDYFFTKKNFHLMLSNYISKKSFKKNN